MGRGPVGEPAIIRYVNNSLASVTDVSGIDGDMILIKTLTADGSGTSLSFVNGASDVVLDSTYPIYKFVYNNIHPATNEAGLYVNFRDGSTAYDATKTTTYFAAEHRENDSTGGPGYSNGSDLAQSTSAQKLTGNIGNDNDQSASGELYLFSPSSTTFIKHFFGTGNEYQGSDYTTHCFYSGYCNVTAAIDAVQFSMSSGNMDSGTIKLYGIKDS